jgi:fluoroacetyl-CoA thioesterase
MTESLAVGRSLELEKVVTPELTADRFGNPGVQVFATPALVAFLEETAIRCVAPTLEDGQATVGTRVELKHLAATPAGMKVFSRVELVEIDRKRLVFRFEARDEREQIATGTHDRFIINSMTKFLDAAAEKSNG